MKSITAFACVLVALVAVGSLGGACETGRAISTIPPVRAEAQPATSTLPAVVESVVPATRVLPAETETDVAEAFAITLVAGGVTPADLLGTDDLEDITLAAAPLVTAEDLLAYDVASHVFTLTVEAAERLTALEVPVSGRSFVLSVDGVPIYAGALWVPYSSLSYDGVTIMILPDYGAGAFFPEGSGTFQLALGYPGSDFFVGPDPRSDPRVVDALTKLGVTR